MDKDLFDPTSTEPLLINGLKVYDHRFLQHTNETYSITTIGKYGRETITLNTKCSCGCGYQVYWINNNLQSLDSSDVWAVSEHGGQMNQDYLYDHEDVYPTIDQLRIGNFSLVPNEKWARPDWDYWKTDVAEYLTFIFNRYTKENQKVIANLTDNQGMSILMYWCKVGYWTHDVELENTSTPPFDYPGITQFLIDHGAKVNWRSPLGNTPLIYACGSVSERYLPLVKTLVENGAQVNDSSDDGATPLLLACADMNNIQVVQYLIERGADPTAVGEDGNSCLFYVCQTITSVNNHHIQGANMKQCISIVKLLLFKGANPTIKNKAGQSAITECVGPNDQYIDVTMDGKLLGQITGYIQESLPCGSSKIKTLGGLAVALKPGTYNYQAVSKPLRSSSWNGTFTIQNNQCSLKKLVK